MDLLTRLQLASSQAEGELKRTLNDAAKFMLAYERLRVTLRVNLLDTNMWVDELNRLKD